MHHAQHRAAAVPPQRQDYQPYQPFIPGAIPPPAKPRKTRNHLVARVVILAFIAQFPAWALVFLVPPGPAGTMAAITAAVASGVVFLGMLYGACYGVYRVVRWALGL
jgi:hypothetical protein